MMKRILRASVTVCTGLLLCTILLAGCIRIVKDGGTTVPAATPTTTPAPPMILITLERTPCFGTCPVYSLKISGNGAVVYDGKDHVKLKGVQETTISAGAVNQLVLEFENTGYFSLNDSYTKFEITDMPSANTSITIGRKTKSIKHYYGDRSAPKQLTELEKKIDDTVNSAQWIK
ncbi:MAG: hypothetical protein A2Z02_00150 [Chloroflexi bacterium RBG_16_48_7]|nr:MAG: hypothetical protein A2Z02_00150 [Chloroflexi bacterium RBG_16_48_7]